ncbi:hypothetical protein GY45DRAFT_1437142, partial [Cubamyces sp. BRFM 1775]
MASRQGGKLKPLKASHTLEAPKKDKKDLDEEDVAFQQKKKADEAALKAARDKAAKGEDTVCIIMKALYLDNFHRIQVALLVVVSRSRARNRPSFQSVHLVHPVPCQSLYHQQPS